MPRFILSFILPLLTAGYAQAASTSITYGQTLSAALTSLIAVKDSALDPRVTLKNAGGVQLATAASGQTVDLTYKIATAGKFDHPKSFQVQTCVYSFPPNPSLHRVDFR